MTHHYAKSPAAIDSGIAGSTENMEPFQYEPIIRDEHGFRIARLYSGTEPDIRVDLIHASLEESDIMEYEALSYVWGSSHLTTSIHVGEKSLKITNSLDLVLRDLRLPDQDRYLWIDGICIDQGKDTEKTHQVRQMGKIYRRAERVVFHLGYSSEQTHILRETLSVLSKLQRLRPQAAFESIWCQVGVEMVGQYQEYENRIRESVESVLAAPWFRRIWIIQEVANARKGLIHWGSASFPVAPFIQVVQHLGIQTDQQQTAILDMMPQRRCSKSIWSSRQDLYHLLKFFRRAEASHDHDRIFALMGMCAEGKGHGALTADYAKSLDIVMREAIAYMAFCDKDDIAIEFDPLYKLFHGIDYLLGDLALHLAINKRLKGLQSLLSNRGDEVVITDQLARQALLLDDRDVTLLLLQHFRTTNATFLGLLLTEADAHCDSNIDRLLRLGAEKSLAFTFDWADRLVPPSLGMTSLWNAALNHKKDLVKQLLIDGADANALYFMGLSLLGWAVMEDKEDIVKILLEYHADIEAGFLTPLCLAAEHGRLNIVKLLLDQGANINSRDDRGRTALSLAASAGHAAILSCGTSKVGNMEIERTMRRRDAHESSIILIQKWLTAPRADRLCPSQQSRLDQTTRCLVASSVKDVGTYRGEKSPLRGHIEPPQLPPIYSEIVELLLLRGADVESQDVFGQTPLWWAVNWGHLPIVEKLLQKKANIETKAGLNMSPLSWAIWNGHRGVVQKLLDNHAKVNHIEPEDRDRPKFRGAYPLFWVICSGNKSQLLQLLDNGLKIPMNAAIDVALSEHDAAFVLLLLGQNAALAKRYPDFATKLKKKPNYRQSFSTHN